MSASTTSSAMKQQSATAPAPIKPMSIADEIMAFYNEKIEAIKAERAKKQALFIVLEGNLFGVPVAGTAQGSLDFKAAAAATPSAQVGFDF
jgi:hypothetical protein